MSNKNDESLDPLHKIWSDESDSLSLQLWFVWDVNQQTLVSLFATKSRADKCNDGKNGISIL